MVSYTQIINRNKDILCQLIVSIWYMSWYIIRYMIDTGSEFFLFKVSQILWPSDDLRFYMLSILDKTKKQLPFCLFFPL